jgi:2-amino-4-hydroxy-6-hydroxymethyldihydropteridine diphosphokinase
VNEAAKISGGASRGGLPQWAVVSPERAAHVGRVVEMLTDWAHRLELAAEEQARWVRAGWLHDALRDADEATLRRWSGTSDGPVVLLHGPAAAARAEADGEGDSEVLAAVRWHTVGFADWGSTGRALYCADYLEPGRRFAREERAAMAAGFAANPDGVLRQVIAARIARAARTGKPVPAETAAFIAAFG